MPTPDDTLTPDGLKERIASALASGAPHGLATFRSTRLPEVRHDKGADVAEKLLLQLAAILRGAARPGDIVGRVDEDTVGVLISASPAESQRAAGRLARATREGARWPVATGHAHSEGHSGGAEALLHRALEAAREVIADDAAEVAKSGGALAARFQRLSLLNRMSLELFSEKPFPQALAQACHVLLGLTGARAASVHFSDELGSLRQAYRHAEGGLSDHGALEAEAALVRRACEERTLVSTTAGGRGWLGAPLLRLGPDSVTVLGAVTLGYSQPAAVDPDREAALVAAARLLRDARVIQLSLQRSRVHTEIFEQTADAIILTDLDGRVLSWNQAAHALFGWSVDEAVGRVASFLVPEPELARARELAAQALAEGRTTFEAERLRKDGAHVAVEGTLALVRDEHDEPFGMVGSFRDISKRRQVERMRTEFITLVTHELRTPLTAIRGFAETLVDLWNELTTEQRGKYLRIVLDESKRLTDLVTDFLDITKIEAGAVDTVVTEVDLAAVARRAADLLKNHPNKPDIHVEVAADARHLWGDEDQLYRLLVNLCGNAVKYTPPGGRITIASSADGADIRLSVADQGPGIAPQDLPRLFEKFYRASDAVARKTPGTGLGLTICKGIVENHKGRISVESQPGKGARFIAALPREALKP